MLTSNVYRSGGRGRSGLYLGMCLLAYAANAQTLNLGTAGNAAAFKITGAGATAAQAFQAGNGISLTSTANSNGTFVPGGSLVNFNGFWIADETFFLPANATAASLNFSLSADDRVVLQLNDVTIGDFSLGTPNPFSGPGLMKLTSGGTDNPFVFSGTASGLVTTGFNFGGFNTLRLIVNNTNGGATGTTKTFQGIGDFKFRGTDCVGELRSAAGSWRFAGARQAIAPDSRAPSAGNSRSSQ
ncbi:MAG: hypothetical protein ACKV22_22920 [Bryobacteraceae bacterium]